MGADQLMDIYAKVIADSISPLGDRLITVEANIHRFILAELNTHRAFSRNSASSRAIPTRKLIEQVRTNPALPLEWGSNKPGMQAGPEVAGAATWAEEEWRTAAGQAAYTAELLSEHAGIHKQIVNRLLEPFMWHRVIISSTTAGWVNFFEQRRSPLAQPEIRAAADAIYAAMSDSKPIYLGPEEWHLPYVTEEERECMSLPTQRKVSAARCARVSYLTHEGVRDVSKDLELYDRLITADPPHYSPLEHVATPGTGAGNFQGWAQLRHLKDYQ